MSERILVCTDLDGTLIPDGRAPESPAARPCFARLAARPEVCLAFVTGRHRGLVEEAIAEFSLPTPRFVIADVGATIYEVTATAWRRSPTWESALAAEWGSGTSERLRSRLRPLADLELQEESRQAEFKLSYYAAPELEAEELLPEVRRRLSGAGVRARLIFSRDRHGIGLLDLVPPRAGKLSAIESLLERQGFVPHRFLFAGDSGNDMEVLVSRLPAVLVANATDAVKRQAREAVEGNGNGAQLYLARGGLLGMNGNYGGGVLEGLARFLPETVRWLQ